MFLNQSNGKVFFARKILDMIRTNVKHRGRCDKKETGDRVVSPVSLGFASIKVRAPHPQVCGLPS